MRRLTHWIVVASLVWTAGYVHTRYFDPEVDWIQSLYHEKMQREGEVEAPRRVLIVGGSGTHFGVDALQIERELDIPVFNMGLHAGLGLNAILASISSEIQPGDIVLLIPEYGLLTNEGTGDFSSGFGAAIGRPGLGGVGPEQIAKEVMLMGVPGSDRIVQSIKRLKKSIDSTGTGHASSSDKSNEYFNDIDERGSPLVLPSGNPMPQSVREHISEHNRRRLETFRREVEGSGATLVFGLPWLLSASDDESLKTVRVIVDELAEIAPVVYDDTFNLKKDPTLFGDTAYHLSDRGRGIRSSNIAQQLKPVIN